MGGDEINIIKPGRNYGWAGHLVRPRLQGGATRWSIGNDFLRDRTRTGKEEPFWFWSPSPAVAGIVIYTGDKFPNWKGNVFHRRAWSTGCRRTSASTNGVESAGFPQRQGTQSMLASSSSESVTSSRGPMASCI